MEPRLPADLPPESRIAVLESTPDVFEVRLRPPGWKRSYTWRLILLGVLSGVWGVAAIMSYSGDSPGLMAFLSSGILACYMLGLPIYWGLTWKRMAAEWTHVRLESGRLTIRRPGIFWGEKTTSFPLEQVEKHPRERYSTIHRLKFSGADTQFVCWTSLTYADVKWLISCIDNRIRGSESNNGDG